LSCFKTSHCFIALQLVCKHQIRTASGRQGTVISLRAKLYKYETKLTLPRWQEKMIRCCVTLKQASTVPGLGSSEFELSITSVSLRMNSGFCCRLSLHVFLLPIIDSHERILREWLTGGRTWSWRPPYVHSPSNVGHLCCWFAPFLPHEQDVRPKWTEYHVKWIQYLFQLAWLYQDRESTGNCNWAVFNIVVGCLGVWGVRLIDAACSRTWPAWVRSCITGGHVGFFKLITHSRWVVHSWPP